VPAILIKNTVTNTVTLSSATQDPGLFAVIGHHGVVDTGTSSTAIYGTNEYAWMVSNRGTVSGERGVGLADGGTVSNFGSIYGSSDGVYACNSSGNAYLTVINHAGASITASSSGGGRAIDAANGLSLLNVGSIDGGYGCSFGVYARGSANITNTAGGTISGGYYGITVNHTGANLAITNKGSIGGGRDGLFFEGGNSGGTVVNSGTIAGGRYGIYGCNDGVSPLIVNSGSIGGDHGGIGLREGILLRNSGTITSTGTTTPGSIRYESTVYAYSGSVNNSGLISGGAFGVVFNDTGTVINAGSIYGVVDGVYMSGAASATGARVVNHAAGVIHGGQVGVNIVDNGGATVINAGSIRGDAFAAVFFEGSTAAGSKVINSGTLSGGQVGISTGLDWLAIINSGSIYGYNAGIDVYSAIKLANSGTITGGYTTLSGAGNLSAVYALSGSITNDGRISGGKYGVDFKNKGTVANSGSIYGGGFGIWAGQGISLVNSGTIRTSPGGGSGVYVKNFAQVDNQAGGYIDGQNYGLRIYDAGVPLITNEGLIHAGLAGVLFEGSDSGGTLINTGTITSGGYGIASSNNSPRIVNSGSIYGYFAGAYSCSGSTLNLVNLAGGSITSRSSKYGAVHASGNAILSNAGSIYSHYGAGVSAGYSCAASTSYAAVTNLAGGTIASGEGSAIYSAGAGLSVTNFGLINGMDADGSTGNLDGVGVYGKSGGSVTNAAPGAVIIGYHWGVYVPGTASSATTVSNRGTITGGDGAVHFGDANGNVFQVFRGAVEYGIVQGGAGQDTLELGKSVNPGVIKGIGPRGEFRGFETLSVDAGAVWSIAGHNVLPGHGAIDVGLGATLTGTGNLRAAGDLTVMNAGYIGDAGHIGIDTGKMAFVTNDAGATIYGCAEGIFGKQGVSLTNAGTITNSITHGDVAVYGGQHFWLNNQAGGLISGRYYGIGTGGAAGTTIDNAGLISGGRTAVLFEGSDIGGTLTNSGTISGATNYGIYGYSDIPRIVNSGSIYGYNSGIYSRHSSVTLDNTSGGTVTSRTGEAVLAGGGISVVNAGYIYSKYDNAMVSCASAIVTNQAGGTITSGQGYAIYSYGAGLSVTNYGLINGMDADGSPGDFDGIGVYGKNGGIVTNASTSAVIAGYHWGVYFNPSSSSSATVTNHGTISGGDGAVHFSNRDGNVFQVFAGAVENGVVLGGTGQDTLELGASGKKTGVIRGIGPTGQFQGFETLQVDAGARWTLKGRDVLPANGTLDVGVGATLTVAGNLRAAGDLTLLNAGYIANPASSGIDVHKMAFVTNYASATIYGGQNGIYAQGGISLTNAGVIQSAAGGKYGVYSFHKTSVTNQASGYIYGGRAGLDVNHSKSPMVSNAGSIAGGTFGVLFEGSDGSGTLDNSGTITGGRFGIYANAGTPKIVNSGSISGHQFGVYSCNGSIDLTNAAGGSITSYSSGAVDGYHCGGAVTVVNAGTIYSHYGAGVTSSGDAIVTNLAGGTIASGEGNAVFSTYSGMSVTNYGVINGMDADSSSGNLDGIGVYGKDGGVVTNATASAVIEGYHWGVYIPGSASSAGLVTNSGTISGTDGGAVHFGNADGNVFQVFRGSVENGVVQGGTGQDTLELSAMAGLAGMIGGIGPSGEFTGFETVAVDAGARWQLTGSNTLAAGGTVDLGGGSVLTITGDTSAAGPMTIGGGGALVVGATGTLTMQGTIDTASVMVAGTLATGGTLDVVGGISGPGTIDITPNTLLNVNGDLTAANVVFLHWEPETLSVNGVVSGDLLNFHAGDTIDLLSIGNLTGSSWSGKNLVVDGTAGTISLHFGGFPVTADFNVTDIGGGTIAVTHS